MVRLIVPVEEDVETEKKPNDNCDDRARVIQVEGTAR